MKNAYLFLLLVLSPVMAVAAERTVELSVPGMNCPACPITVKKSLEAVEGVKSASVDYDSKTATVVYEDGLTDSVALQMATTNAGYPSEVKDER